MSPKKGVERKRGNWLGIWFFRMAVRLFGLGGAYGLLYIVCLYYLIVDRAVVEASLAFVRRRFPEHSPWRRMFDVYLLFVSQGKCLIDRYAVAAGYDEIAIEIRGYDKLRQLLAEQDKGFILLTAHVGNWQLAMTALSKLGRTVHLMMRPEDNRAVKNTLNLDNEGEGVRIIFTDDALGGVIEAMKALNQGDLVSIMGDRAYEYSATEAPFLGGDVRFPYGAFSIAAAARCPVVVFLSAKIATKKYIVDVSHVIPAPKGGRGNRDTEMRGAAREFAHILEEYVVNYPFQWFVFRDIWKSND